MHIQAASSPAARQAPPVTRRQPVVGAQATGTKAVANDGDGDHGVEPAGGKGQIVNLKG